MKIVKMAIAALTIGLMFGCAPAAAPSAAPKSTQPVANIAPLKGGTFTRAMTSEPASVDPQGAATSGLSLIAPYLFDTLVTRNVNNQLVPLLAASWQVAEDGKAITMQLVPGVKFQDGTPFNAAAVRATFVRFKKTGTKSPIYDGIQRIDDIQVIDDLTVRFTFKQPSANFWSTITMPYAGILSPASIEKVDSAGKGNVMGSGPFLLSEWKAGQSITLKRNPEYTWGASVTENRAAPYIDAMVFEVIPDAATQLAALQSGTVDAIFINQPDDRAMLQRDPTIQLVDAELNSLIYLAFNCKKAPFDDVRVRQALSFAVDKDAIVKVPLGGIGKVASSYLPPALLGYDASLNSYVPGFDANKSQSLLRDAGFTRSGDGAWARGGQPLKGLLITSNRAPNDSIAALLQSQLKAVGVPVDIQMMDSKAIGDATAAGKFDLLLYRYDWNDPDALSIYLGSDRIGSTNRAAYSSPAVDKLLAQGASTLDQAKRVQIYAEAQKLIGPDAPWQPLYVPVDVMAYSKRFDGVKVGYMGRMLMNDVSQASDLSSAR